MALYVQQGVRKLQFGRSAILGRDDFFGDKMLSRRHAKIFERQGSVFIKDLGSRNGTFVNGKKIEPKTDFEIFPQDKIKMGNVEFICFRVEVVTHGYAPAKRLIYMFLGIFAVLAGLTLLDPTLDYGRSIGPLYLLYVLGSLGVATFVCYLVWIWLVIAGPFSWRKTVSFVLLVMISSAILNAVFFYRLNSDWSLGVRLITAKIHYFCVERFDQVRCVDEVSFCPSCAAKIDKSERQVAIEKLKSYRSQYPEEAQARLKALEDKREPAESSGHD